MSTAPENSASDTPKLSDMELLLGKNLMVSVDKKEATKSALGDASIVALYFSASWCPPCRSFTPMLSQFYKAAKSLGVEIVFVSSDRDTSSFNEYFAKMPWLAIPHEAEHFRRELSSVMKVQGIPTLIILDAKTGKLISDSGRTEVMSAGSDAKDLVAQWKTKEPQSLSKIGGGNSSLLDILKKMIRIVGFYFLVKFIIENYVSE